MKRIVYSILLASLMTPTLAVAQDFQKGDVAAMPDRSFVRIADEKIANSDRTFYSGDSCYIQRNGRFTIVDSRGGDYLRVLYSIKSIQTHEQCPNNATLWVWKSDLEIVR